MLGIGADPGSERASSLLTRDSATDHLLPSRSLALDALRSALLEARGPVVLTGDSGSGKTWLVDHLRASLPTDWRWAEIALSPSLAAADLPPLILQTLGVHDPGTPANARRLLADALRERSQDGERWGLVLDEAHNASDALLEETRVLGNRLGAPGALSAILLLAPNTLLSRLAHRANAPLASRISARLHLRPISVDELRHWLPTLDPSRPWPTPDVEHLHRDASGLPARILALLGRITPRLTPKPIETPAPLPFAPPIATPTAPLDRWEPTPVAPVRPPIDYGDEMIEVGWQPETEPDSELETPEPPTSAVAPPTDHAPVVIDDHYAALQAWNEWARNQGRHPAPPTAPPENDDDSDLTNSPLDAHPDLWADSPHDFAPYSQLFSRLKPSRESS